MKARIKKTGEIIDVNRNIHGLYVDENRVGFENHAKVQDYLNSIHVDYRGLIPLGLALEAPKNMYVCD